MRIGKVAIPCQYPRIDLNGRRAERTTGSGGDSVELSGLRSPGKVDGYSNKLLPSKKIEFIRNKIANGYYFTSGFSSILADSMLKNPEFLADFGIGISPQKE